MWEIVKILMVYASFWSSFCGNDSKSLEFIRSYKVFICKFRTLGITILPIVSTFPGNTKFATLNSETPNAFDHF